MNNTDIMLSREYLIVKNNDLIQKSRYSLNLQEQKIMLYIISKIQPEDTEFKLYDFYITEFCEVCGIDKDNGKNYIDLKNTIKKLSDKSIWVTIDDKGTETLFRWVDKPYINQHSGLIRIKLDNDMKPYLLELKKHFTQFNLLYTLAMKSKYGVRLYELLKSYENLGKWTVSVDDLKTKLNAETYARFSDLHRKVVMIALDEINKYSDIKVKYRCIKDGKKVTNLQFEIKIKKDSAERIKTFADIEDRLL